MDQYIYDTTYVYILDTVLSTEYVYDTVSTYEYDLVGVECDTGLPCLEPIPECPIYLPNAFTPDNDGLNDVWGAETNESCGFTLDMAMWFGKVKTPTIFGWVVTNTMSLAMYTTINCSALWRGAPMSSAGM